jgi:hypothetical protein
MRVRKDVRKIGLKCFLLASLLVAGNACYAQSIIEDLPTSCNICKAESGSWRIAIGPFSLEAGLLVKSVLPAVVAGDIRQEPWIFDLVVTQDGTTCMVRRSLGPPGHFADQIVEKVLRWRFTPFIHNGRPMCLRSSLYFYVTKEQNRIVLRVPGVTEPF